MGSKRAVRKQKHIAVAAVQVAEVETMLVDLRAFLDDPIALLRRATFVLEEQAKRKTLALFVLLGDWRAVAGGIASAYFASNGHDQWAYWLNDRIPGGVGDAIQALAIQLLP